MRWLRFTALVLIGTILQAGVVDIAAVTAFNIKPDLLLIFLVFFAAYFNTFDAIIASFAVGFAADLIGPVMGPGMLSFGLFGTLLAHLHNIITVRKMPYQALVIFVTAFLVGLLTHLLNLFKGQHAAAATYAVIFGTAVYSALFGPFLFLPLAWCMRIKARRFRSR